MKRYLLFGLPVIILWLISPILISFLNQDWVVRGQIGDSYGALNTLFSGLAFVGLIITILLQREDLKIQNETLVLQIEEQKKQAAETERMANELENQKKLMTLQRVESTLFQLIKTFQDYRETIQYRVNSNETKTGQDALSQIYNWIQHATFNEQKSDKEKFDIMFSRLQHQLHNYFRMIIYILQYLNDSSINDSEKMTFADCLNLNMNDHEIILIYLFYMNKQHELLLLKKYNFYDRLTQINSDEDILDRIN